MWVARAALHGIHSIFPNPEITQHLGGRDSISVKKLEKGDGKFLTQKIVLGFLFDGQPGAQRTIGLPKEKADSYIEHIRGALDNARHYISKTEFQKLHGRLAHASTIMPCMTGFMSELNRVLAAACITVGLGKHSKLRRILEDYVFFLGRAHTNPSHITELVGPALPHIYGYTDASRTGMGGTLLPATRWIAPTVWRLQYPPDIVELFDNGHISINDLELAANFLTERIGENELAGDMQGLNSWLGSDNTATVSWKTKKSTRAKAESHFAPQALRAEALLQRHTRRGPQDIGHIAGTSNTMGDFPSRSHDQGYMDNPEGDERFLRDFSQRLPLPTQLGRWQLVRPNNAVIFAVFSMLRSPIEKHSSAPVGIGDIGPLLPFPLDSILYSPTPSANPTTWNEQCCSWPLLSPCGRVDSMMGAKLEGRRSRERFENARSSWSPRDFAILANQLSPTTDSHNQ
jgi:hypothetical protein